MTLNDINGFLQKLESSFSSQRLFNPTVPRDEIYGQVQAFLTRYLAYQQGEQQLIEGLVGSASSSAASVATAGI